MPRPNQSEAANDDDGTPGGGADLKAEGFPDALIARLERLAFEIRRYATIAIHHAGSGHPGGSLSCADILAVLYGAEMAVTPQNADDPDRDRFVLSKGHAAPALYGAGAARGFLEPADIPTLRKLGSKLQGHPHVLDLPWVEASTGSLGQGFSTAVGMALGLRHKGSGARVYALLGDGELQEGEIWEGAMCAAHYGLGALTAIVDYNKMQSDDLNANIMGLEPLADKWRAFGWHVQEIDGNDVPQIIRALNAARAETATPSVVVAHTVKGRGVPYMEGKPLWHGSVKMTEENTRAALEALDLSQDRIEEWLHGRI